MKICKCALAALFCLMLTEIAMAQLGIRAGINIANVDFEFIDNPLSVDTKSRVGVQAGVFYEIAISEQFAVQPELLFLQKGFIVEDSNDDFIRILNFLELPVLAKYTFDQEIFLFFLQAGPSIGYAFNGKDKVGSLSEDIDFDQNDIDRIDLGAHLGGGFGVPLGNGNLLLDFRYLLGFTNLNEEDDPEVRTRGLALSLGYKLNFN